MKANIHPEYKTCTVKCACGNTFETGSVRESMSVDICSNCHPFYTGRQKLVDTGGRVDKFKRRMGQVKED
ncbi:MAG TPA: 50S ribosomal protein L31 [Fastidiosipila sp.]|jgi:large subunit ribosomal protein L31|nr:50S ribosomal protein L31 [Fastidiosipila sp.]